MVLGFSFQDSANGWSWPGLNVKVSELSVDNWTKVSGYLTNNRTALKQAMVRISIPNTPKVRLGDAFLIDDLIITDVTDAKAALDAADANAQALSSLSASVTQNGKNITSQGSAITKLQSDVTQLGKDISGKADASALTNLTTRVTATEGGLKSQGDSLTSLQNSLNTTNSNVAKKADATALQSLQNTVEQHGRDLTTQSSALTNLENNFSSLAVGGTNLIRNADTLEGWSSRHATETYLGDRVAYTRLAKGASGYTQLDEQTLDVTGRTEFVFSFYAKGAYDGQEMASYFYNPSNTTTTETSQGVKGGAGDGKAVTKLTTAWARYWVKWVIPATSGTKRLIAARLESATSADKEVWLCRPQLETGTVMTDWSPSPDDAASGITANTSAINSLTSRVTNAEGKLDSQSQQLTSLQNSLTTMNTELGKKADTSAVSSLTGRVSQVENTITSQSQSITSLTSSINTISTQGANPWVDGTFESYGDGHVLGGGGTAVVVASQKFTGNKSLQVSRGANNNGNSDKQLGSWQSVREDAKFRFEFWAMMPADQAPSSGWTTLVGINSLNAAGQNSWQSAVTVSEAALGARDKWVKFTGIASNNGGGRTRAVVWISTRGASGSGTPGYSLYIDDLVITDVTDAKAAQDASDATASAVSGLTARVTDAEGKITAQAQQQTALATKVDNANSRVDNMAKTLSDSQSTQASLNTSLQSQIDAQAAANIKNQTTLDNTIKSVASITSTQQTHATALEALATQQTTLTSSVGDLSASVQNTAKTVADVNGTVSSLWSMKVETVNGKNVGAGITLGSNGETSDMILYADRFSLFNRNNATAVPVMVAEGNELYIDTARIKNSSLTSAKIADGSITNAKIGNEIRSNNFVDGSQGWRIAKDGSSQFNNVIVRGRVEANSGVFRGTVQADSFIGDIAVAKSYDSLTFRRNQTVQRNGAYQNRGYSMTVVLACTLVCQTYGTGSGLGYTSDITFNIGGQEVTRRIFVDAGNITGGTTAFELRFAARLDADYNNVGFFIRASGRTAAIDYTCTVENITATAFRTDSSSFS